MVSVNKIFLILYFAFSIASAQKLQDLPGDNEELKKQFIFAQELYNNENYFDAITELKRLLFFDKNGEYNYSAKEMIAQCYKQGAKFTDAMIWFTKAEMNVPDTPHLIHIKLEKIKINILRRNISQALAALDSLNKVYPDTNHINYWKGWAYAFADDWHNAEVYFSRTKYGDELRQLSEKTDSDKYNVRFAKIISYFLPGAGQAYTGHYFSGLLSLGWNLLWGYTTVTAFQAERIFDGVMVANFLWLRFYTGNTYNAEQFAIEENQKISNKALDYMQYKYTGEKP